MGQDESKLASVTRGLAAIGSGRSKHIHEGRLMALLGSRRNFRKGAVSGPLYCCLGRSFRAESLCRCHRRQVYGEIAVEPLWIGRGAKHMLKDIQRVEKSGASR